MNSILNDIGEDIEIKIKPNKTNFYLKWIIRIVIILISVAFAFGQINEKFFNKINNIEKNQKQQNEIINELNNEIKKTNKRIDKIYDDGFLLFTQHQDYTIKQLVLILDYDNINKNLLKNMLEIYSDEYKKNMQIKINTIKNNPIDNQ